MVTEKVITNTRLELLELIAECETQRENPRIVRLAKCLLALLQPDDPGEVEQKLSPEILLAKQQTNAVEETARLENMKADVAHRHTPNVYGVCNACGTCLHTNRHSQTGFCITCGEPA